MRLKHLGSSTMAERYLISKACGLCRTQRRMEQPGIADNLLLPV